MAKFKNVLKLVWNAFNDSGYYKTLHYYSLGHNYGLAEQTALKNKNNTNN